MAETPRRTARDWAAIIVPESVGCLIFVGGLVLVKIIADPLGPKFAAFMASLHF